MKNLSWSKSAFVMLLGALSVGAVAQGGAPPFAGRSKVTIAQAMAQAPKLDPALMPLAKAQTSAEMALKKKPKDAKTKKAYVDATYRYAHAIDIDQGKMAPPIQYRAALGFYRKVLAVDPKHAPSLSEKKTIEDIYTQMGMPIPK